MALVLGTQMGNGTFLKNPEAHGLYLLVYNRLGQLLEPFRNTLTLQLASSKHIAYTNNRCG